MRAIPDWTKPAVIAVFTSFFFATLRGVRRAVGSNLVPVLGPCGFVERQRRIFRTLHRFAWCQTERYEALSGAACNILDVVGREHWEGLSGQSAGFILATAHIGNWEVGASFAANQGERQVHVVRAEELDARAQTFVRKLLQERLGAAVVTHFAADEFTLGITLLDALRKGHLVAVQGDRAALGGRTVRVDLFGRPFDLPAGPFILARVAGVPVLPVFVLREARFRYRAVFRSPIRVPNTADRSADIRAAADAMVRAIEWAITEQPHQWYCFRNLWPSG